MTRSDLKETTLGLPGLHHLSWEPGYTVCQPSTKPAPDEPGLGPCGERGDMCMPSARSLTLRVAHGQLLNPGRTVITHGSGEGLSGGLAALCAPSLRPASPRPLASEALTHHTRASGLPWLPLSTDPFNLLVHVAEVVGAPRQTPAFPNPVAMFIFRYLLYTTVFPHDPHFLLQQEE